MASGAPTDFMTSSRFTRRSLLHDLIRVSLARGRGIEIRCDDPRVPRDESNTCYRIIEKTIRSLNAKGRVLIEIEKRLAVQGGMGGASSNAVAAMLGLERVLRKYLATEERLRIAAEVGSDLPLFLIGGTVLGVGRGEQVYPLEDLPATACVMVTPQVGVSTPKAFAEWDRRLAENAQELKPALNNEAYPLKGRSLPGELTASSSSDRIKQLGREFSAWLSESYSGAPLSLRSMRGRAGNPLLALVRTGIQNDFEQVVFPEYPELREDQEGAAALRRKVCVAVGFRFHVVRLCSCRRTWLLGPPRRSCRNRDGRLGLRPHCLVPSLDLLARPGFSFDSFQLPKYFHLVMPRYDYLASRSIVRIVNRKLAIVTGPSTNGRSSAFGALCLGSNPSGPAKISSQLPVLSSQRAGPSPKH